jgi:hypothetical protein
LLSHVKLYITLGISGNKIEVTNSEKGLGSAKLGASNNGKASLLTSSDQKTFLDSFFHISRLSRFRRRRFEPCKVMEVSNLKKSIMANGYGPRPQASIQSRVPRQDFTVCTAN